MSVIPNRPGKSSSAPVGSVRLHHPPAPTVGEIIDKFLKHKERQLDRDNIAKTTLADYRYFLGMFRQYLGDKLLIECNGMDMTEWLDSRTGWRSDNTIKGALARVQACFNWWARLSESKNPFRAVTHRWGPSRKPVSQSEFDKFFAAITCRRVAQVFMMIRLTGCRPDEIYKLKKNAIQLEHPACIVLEKHKNERRTRRNRRIPLNAACVAVLHDALAVNNGSEYVFLTRRKTPYDKDSFGHECRRICKRAGLKGISPYRLRHSVSLTAHKAGTPIKTIADFLGTSVQMLSRYYLSHSHELTEDLVNMAQVIADNKLPEIPAR